MDDYKFRMVEMMHLYLSGMIVRERIFYTSTGCTKKLTIE